MDSEPDSRPAFAYVLLGAALLLATGLAPLEWVLYYRARVERGALPAWDHVVLMGAIAAKSLVAFAPGLVVAAILSWLKPRAAIWVGGVLLGLCACALAVDFRAAMVIGNHLTRFIGLLGDPEPFQWAGDGGGLLTPILETVATVGAISALVVGSLFRLTQNPRLRDRLPDDIRGWSIGGGLTLGVILAPGVLGATLERPIHMARLTVALPWSIVGGGMGSSPASTRVDRMLGSSFARYVESLDRAQPVERVTVPTERRPDVVVIVLESFRHESIDPRWMPRLSAWAKGGLRASQHFSGSNVSQLGLFSLLYGRSPLSYVAALRDKVPAQLPQTLRESGYLSLLFTSTRLEWHRMEVYLSALNFDGQRLDTSGDWFERDQRTIAALESTLAAEERPVFAFVFLMSTHFDYRHPPEYAGRHQPAAARAEPWVGLVSQGTAKADAVPRVLNRYRNTLAFMDDLLGEFVESLDAAKTMVVITGDHGESFLDDGTWLHSSRLSDAQSRVPLIAVGGGIPVSVRRGLSSHMDLTPTLLGILGATPELKHTHGRDLLGAERVSSQVLLVDMSLQQTLLILPEGRLAVQISADRTRAQTLGFLNEKGEFGAEPRGDTPDWAEAFRRELDWVTR